MGKLLRSNWKEIVKVVAIIFIASYIAVEVSTWLQGKIVQENINSLGVLGPVLIIIYMILSHIVAPLAGTPGTVAALSIYGLGKAIVIIYIASLMSATINFYIARKLGRRWVIKLAGKDSIKRIDQITKVMGTKLLIIARIFGAPVYEFVSYAAGFTNIGFKKYILITATVSFIPGVIISYLFYNSLESSISLSVLLGSLIVLGLLFTWYVVKLYHEATKSAS